MSDVKKAEKRLAKIIKMQKERIELMKTSDTKVDFKKLDKIIIGVVPGDGIGPLITASAEKVLSFVLAEEIKNSKIEIREIEGLSLENRLKEKSSLPQNVLNKLKECHVILKGPTSTPEKGSNEINLESANVVLRKELDLFANIRPVKVPEEGIDWTFYRENTEGSYAVGSLGIEVDEDLAIDFTITTSQGSERIARAAFEFARRNKKKRVTVVTKANVIKTTDGKFLDICKKVQKDYPSIEMDSWYIDIMTAKLLDKKRRKDFQVFLMPNLYGDILTDEAAEIQGGVGTAGSANLGNRYAMFEAIHGSAPRMIEEGRGDYADPSSIIKATSMLINHIGFSEKSEKLDEILEKVAKGDSTIKMTSDNRGSSSSDLLDYIINEYKNKNK